MSRETDAESRRISQIGVGGYIRDITVRELGVQMLNVNFLENALPDFVEILIFCAGSGGVGIAQSV
jgi:hypothetical protein